MAGDKEFSYEVHNGYDKIFEEKGNTFLTMRLLSWNGKEPKLDIRKWRTAADGSEVASKGFSFLTENGPHNLAEMLVEEKFGHTDVLLQSLYGRDDFKPSLNKVLGEDHEHYDEDSKTKGEDFYDPSEFLVDTKED